MSNPNYTSENSSLVKKFIEELENCVEKKDNVAPVLQYVSSDTRIFREMGIPAIQYGPAELETIHSFDEKVSIKELVKSSKVYARSLFKLLS